MKRIIISVLFLLVATFAYHSVALASPSDPSETAGGIVVEISASPDYRYFPEAGKPITIVTSITNTSFFPRQVDSKSTIQGVWWGGIILPQTPDESVSSIEAMNTKVSSEMQVSSEMEVYKVECSFAILGCSFWWRGTIQPGMSASLIIPTVTSGWIGIVEGAAHTETHVLGYGVIHASLTLHGLNSTNVWVYGFFNNSPGEVVRVSGDIYTSTLFLKNIYTNTKDVVLLLVADQKALTNPIIISKPSSLEKVGFCDNFAKCYIELIGSLPPGDSAILLEFNIGSSGYYYQGLGATIIVPYDPLSQAFSNIESMSRIWLPLVSR